MGLTSQTSHEPERIVDYEGAVTTGAQPDPKSAAVYAEYLHGRALTTEIEADPQAAASLARARAEVQEGDVRWLGEGESLDDAIGSD